MIEEFFQIKEKPFLNNLDSRFIYKSSNFEEASARLLYNIQELDSGISLITGEIGCGKTTLSVSLRKDLENSGFLVCVITNPKLSITQLFRKVLEKFGIEDPPSTKYKIFSVIEDFLNRISSEGKSAVLIIDEAQHLSKFILEEIRLLTNLETETKKMIQVVLFGQPELKPRVDKMPQIKQRIYIRYHLGPLSSDEVPDYINHRLKVAGFKGKNLFSGEALEEIFKYSKGIPRVVNTVCMNAMFVAAVKGEKQVSPEIITDIIEDLEG